MASMVLCAIPACSSVAKNTISSVFFIFVLASVEFILLWFWCGGGVARYATLPLLNAKRSGVCHYDFVFVIYGFMVLLLASSTAAATA